MATLLRFIEGVEAHGDMPIERGAESCLRQHRGRGVAVLLSDFLTFGDVPRAMNSLFSKGLETLRGGSFDIIISDFSLPDMDGYEFFKKVPDH